MSNGNTPQAKRLQQHLNQSVRSGAMVGDIKGESSPPKEGIRRGGGSDGSSSAAAKYQVEAVRNGSQRSNNSVGSTNMFLPAGTHFGLSVVPSPANPNLLNNIGSGTTTSVAAGRGSAPQNRYASPNSQAASSNLRRSAVVSTTTSVSSARPVVHTNQAYRSSAGSGGPTVLKSPLPRSKQQAEAQKEFASLPSTPRGSKGLGRVDTPERLLSGSTPPRRLVTSDVANVNSYAALLRSNSVSQTPNKRSTAFTGPRATEIRTPPPTIDVDIFHQDPSLLSPASAIKKPTHTLNFDEDEEGTNPIDRAEYDLAVSYNEGYAYYDDESDAPLKKEGQPELDPMSADLSENDLLFGAKGTGQRGSKVTTAPIAAARAPTLFLGPTVASSTSASMAKQPAASAATYTKEQLDRKVTRKLQTNGAQPVAEDDNAIWTSPDRGARPTNTTTSSTPPPPLQPTGGPNVPRSIIAAATPPHPDDKVLMSQPHDVDEESAELVETPTKLQAPLNLALQQTNPPTSSGRVTAFERPPAIQRVSSFPQASLKAGSAGSSRIHSQRNTPPVSPKISAMLRSPHIPRLAPLSQVSDAFNLDDEVGGGAWAETLSKAEAAGSGLLTSSIPLNRGEADDAGAAGLMLPPTQEDSPYRYDQATQDEDDDLPVGTFKLSSTYVPASSKVGGQFYPNFYSNRQVKEDAFLHQTASVGVRTLITPANGPIRGSSEPQGSLDHLLGLPVPNPGDWRYAVQRHTANAPHPRITLSPKRLPTKPRPPAAPAAPVPIDRSGFINVGNSCYGSSVLTILCRNKSFGLQLKAFMDYTVAKGVKRVREVVQASLEAHQRGTGVRVGAESSEDPRAKAYDELLIGLAEVVRDLGGVANVEPRTVVVRKRLATEPIDDASARAVIDRLGKAEEESVAPSLVATTNPDLLSSETELYITAPQTLHFADEQHLHPRQDYSSGHGVYDMLDGFQTNTEAHIDADNSAHIAPPSKGSLGSRTASLLQSQTAPKPMKPSIVSVDIEAGDPLKLHRALLALVQEIWSRETADEHANVHNTELHDDAKEKYALAKRRHEKWVLPQWERECAAEEKRYARKFKTYQRKLQHQRRHMGIAAAPQDKDEIENSENESTDEEELIISDAITDKAIDYIPNPAYITAATVARGGGGMDQPFDYYDTNGIRPTDIGKVLSEAGFFDGSQHDAPEFLTTIISRLEEEALAFFRWVAFMEAGLAIRGSIAHEVLSGSSDAQGKVIDNLRHDALLKVLSRNLSEIPATRIDPTEPDGKPELVPHALFTPQAEFVDHLMRPVSDVRLLWINMTFQGTVFTTVSCKKHKHRTEAKLTAPDASKGKKCRHKNRTVDTFVSFSVGLPNLKKELDEERKKIIDAATKVGGHQVYRPPAITPSPYLDYLNMGSPPPSPRPSDLDRRIELKLSTLEQRLTEKDNNLRTKQGTEYDLQKLIMSGLAEERIDDYKCDRCGDSSAQFLKASFALPMPPTLLINLKRFRTEWDAARQDLSIDKNNGSVSVNLTLSFLVDNKKSHYGEGLDEEEGIVDVDVIPGGDDRSAKLGLVRRATKLKHIYVLQGVVNHYGRTPYSGHYISTFRFQSYTLITSVPIDLNTKAIDAAILSASSKPKKRSAKGNATKHPRGGDDGNDDSSVEDEPATSKRQPSSRSSTPPPLSADRSQKALVAGPRIPASRSEPALALCLLTDPLDLRCPYVCDNDTAIARKQTGYVPSLAVSKQGSHKCTITTRSSEGNSFRHANDSVVSMIGSAPEIMATRSAKTQQQALSPQKHQNGSDDDDNAIDRSSHVAEPLPQWAAKAWFEQDKHAYLLSYQLVAIVPVEEEEPEV